MALPFDSVRAASSPSPASTDVGGLPQWRLDDLYESMDSPRFAADLERAQREAKRFAEAWRGKLAAIAGAGDGGERLAEAVRAYEALQDLIGRVMSYASLLYASDTSDPARAKFYGDAQERVTALAGDLLFFELELNRIDDAHARGGDGDAGARPLPALARGHPQGEAASARRRHRAVVPRKVGVRRGGVEPAVRRHDGRAALRFRGREPDARAAARQASGSGRREARGRRQRACGDARGESAALLPHHQHAGQGQGNLRPLAQVRRRRRFAPSRQPGRAARWWRRWSPR